MDIVYFKDVPYQCLITTHDKSRKDREITVHGPIPTYEAVEALDSILKDPIWHRELPEEEKKYLLEETNTFCDILESVFLGVISELGNLPFLKPHPTLVGRKLRLTEGSFIWYIQGNITDLHHIEIVNKIMEDAKKQAEAADLKTNIPPTSPKHPIRSFGTYFYPPIWVGKLPRRTFKEKAIGTPYFREKAFDVNYKGKVVVVNEDGFIAIGEQDNLKATKMLNEIMATGLLAGLPFLAARELEVSGAQIHPSNLTITSLGIKMTSLRAQLFHEFTSGVTSIFIYRIEVEKKKLISLIKEAERISRDRDMTDFLVFLLDSYTCLESSEYMQSFMISWIIIERHMFWLWEKFLVGKQVTHKRMEKMLSPGHWSIDFVLETLNLIGHLSQDDYKGLMKLKKRRNAIIHKGVRVSRSEAEGCFSFAKRIVQERSDMRTVTLTQNCPS